jgi:hypothetical protein
MTSYTNHKPLYLNQFYGVWDWSIIRQIDVEFTAINLDLAVYDLALGVVPYYQAAGITLDQLKESPNSIVKSLGFSSGQGRSVIKKSYNVAHELGIHATTRQLWLNTADASSATPADTGHPAIVFLAGAVAGTMVNGITLTSKITFHIEFFELFNPGISTLKQVPQEQDYKEDESMLEDEICVIPSSKSINKPLGLKPSGLPLNSKLLRK